MQTLAAFFLALGIGAHALDELHGRPLQTRIRAGTLVVLATASIAGAVAIGIVVALQVDAWVLAFVAAGAFFVVAYNLELWHGRFHGDLWFAVGWGAFPLLTAYFAQAQRVSAAAAAGAVFAVLTSLAQRELSTQVRTVRRKVLHVTGEIVDRDGGVRPVDEAALTQAPERALRALTGAIAALALALVLLRVT